MFSQAQLTFEKVTEFISDGAFNVLQNSSASESEIRKEKLMEFYRDIRDIICKNLVAKGELDQKTLELHGSFISAVLTKIYKVGACGEYASLGIVEHLIQGTSICVEKVEISGFSDKIDKFIPHVFLILGRDFKSFAEIPFTWKNIIYLDIWPGVAKIKEYKNGISMEDLVIPGYLPEINKVEILLRVESFDEHNWNQMSIFFKNAINAINEETIEIVLKKYMLLGKLNAKDEAQKIQNEFKQTSEQFNLLAKKCREQKLTIEKLKITESPIFFEEKLKKNIHDNLQAISDLTGHKWEFHPKEDKQVAHARLTSSDKNIIKKMTVLFLKIGVKLKTKKIEDKYIAIYENISKEKLDSLSKMLEGPIKSSKETHTKPINQPV